MSGNDRQSIPDAAVNTGASLLLSLMRSKLKFVAFICAVFIAGSIYVDGFSGTTTLMILISVFVVGMFSVLVWFWTAILSSLTTNRREH